MLNKNLFLSKIDKLCVLLDIETPQEKVDIFLHNSSQYRDKPA